MNISKRRQYDWLDYEPQGELAALLDFLESIGDRAMTNY